MRAAKKPKAIKAPPGGDQGGPKALPEKPLSPSALLKFEKLLKSGQSVIDDGVEAQGIIHADVPSRLVHSLREALQQLRVEHQELTGTVAAKVTAQSTKLIRDTFNGAKLDVANAVSNVRQMTTLLSNS